MKERKILTDENLNRRFIDSLRHEGLNVVAVSEQYKGATDIEIAQQISQNFSVVITEDKDFGELIFAYGIAKLTIVFLRYRKEEVFIIEDLLLQAIKNYLNSDEKLFITISKGRIRVSTL